MTLSISAFCPQTNSFGIIVSSSSPAVAARCAHARAGAGVMASQNVTDPALGQKGLDLLQQGNSADAVLEALLETYPTAQWRQLAIIDASGNAATFSGKKTLGTHATVKGKYCAAAGNLLKNITVPDAMVVAFEQSSGQLAERLMRALRAGLDAGGEMGPVHSVGLVVVREVSWPIIDLRVDWCDEDPLTALEAVWQIYKPQVEDYVTRALSPEAAPSYGVPGDE